MNIFNQFSYVLFSLAAIGGAALLLWRNRARRSVIAAAVILLSAIAAAGWALLRPGTQDVDSAQAAQAIIESDRPTLVEFFSNYCVGCMAVRGTVDALVADAETRFGNDLNVLRIDIHTPSGRELRERYGFSYSPEFVIFRGAGVEVWRSHVPPTLDQLAAVVVNGGAVSG